jgi:hypothetical protein
MTLRRVPVIVVDSAGNRRLSGHAMVEGEGSDNRNLKITLEITPDSIVHLMNGLKVEYVQRDDSNGGRAEVVILVERAINIEPEFRIKGL